MVGLAHGPHLPHRIPVNPPSWRAHRDWAEMRVERLLAAAWDAADQAIAERHHLRFVALTMSHPSRCWLCVAHSHGSKRSAAPATFLCQAAYSTRSSRWLGMALCDTLVKASQR